MPVNHFSFSFWLQMAASAFNRPNSSRVIPVRTFALLGALLFGTLSAFAQSWCTSPTMDGYTYDVVSIGNQCWFAKNLRTTSYANGDNIVEATGQSAWADAAANSNGRRCNYANNAGNVDLYGRLYNWYAVDDARGLCPTGWHVPTEQEWDDLRDYAISQGISESVVACSMKSTTGWPSGTNGTDDFGFGVLPTGLRHYDGDWWSPVDASIWRSGTPGYTWYFSNGWTAWSSSSSNPGYGFSVRCLKDPVMGCMDPGACNYDLLANIEDGSCWYWPIAGETCTDCSGTSWVINDLAIPFGGQEGPFTVDAVGSFGLLNITAEFDGENTPGSGEYISDLSVMLCAPGGACYEWSTAFTNFWGDDVDYANVTWPNDIDNNWGTSAAGTYTATIDLSELDGLVGAGEWSVYLGNGWPQSQSLNISQLTIEVPEACKMGCTDCDALNYDPEAEYNDLSCFYLSSTLGCTDWTYAEYSPSANVDDGSCLTPLGYTCVSPEVDGQTYEVVMIGNQCWFAENLNTTVYANGEPIDGALSQGDWAETNQGAMAEYGESDDLCYVWAPSFWDATNQSGNAGECSTDIGSDYLNSIALGKLYNGYAIEDARGLCPDGWHVPTDEEWMALETEMGMPCAELDLTGPFRGGALTLGLDLMAVESWWPEFFQPSTGPTDAFGFQGIPAGYRENIGVESPNSISFRDAGFVTFWWTSSMSEGERWARGLQAYSTGIGRGQQDENYGYSVRCVGNSSETGCTDPQGCNYNPQVVISDGSCDYSCYGCADENACNFDADAALDDGTCQYATDGVCPCFTELNVVESLVGFEGGSVYEFNGSGSLDSLTVWLAFEGVGQSWPSDLLVGVTAPSGSCVDFGGFDWNLVGCADLDPAGGTLWPPTWGVTGNGVYTASMDLGASNLSGNGTWYVQLFNGWNGSDTATYEVNMIIHGLCEGQGCTDANACNYDGAATIDDGSCDFSCYGCTDATACNYDAGATVDDGSCDFSCYGCTDATACNYDAGATLDDGGCSYVEGNCDTCINGQVIDNDADDDGICDSDEEAGCTDPAACNAGNFSDTDNTLCNYADGICETCEGGAVIDNDADDDGVCDDNEITGCTDPTACNYDSNFTTDTDNSLCTYVDGICETCEDGVIIDNDADNDGICDSDEAAGCTDPTACNGGNFSDTDNTLCTYADGICETCQNGMVVDNDADEDGVCDDDEIVGCQEEAACNYDATATDAGDCEYPVDLYGVDYVDCEDNCLNDADGDGVCDEEEIVGCQEEAACNYDSTATDAGECEYPVDLYGVDYVDCDSLCLNDINENGICDEAEPALYGCTDDAACNFAEGASVDDGSCLYRADSIGGPSVVDFGDTASYFLMYPVEDYVPDPAVYAWSWVVYGGEFNSATDADSVEVAWSEYVVGDPGLGVFETIIGCDGQSVIPLFDVTVGLEWTEWKPWRLAPNPTRDGFRLMGADADAVHVRLLNLDGREVQRWNSITGGVWMPLDGCAPGWYAVEIQSPYGRQVLPLLVTR